MSPVVVFILFALCLLIAIPVSITLGIVAVLPGVFDPSFTASASYVIRSMVGGIDSFPLLAVPMFVLAGILMARGQISKRLFDVFSYFLGKRTAGIPCAVIITCLFYGAISGSAPATVAAVGSMTIPLLIDMGYDKVFSTAIVAVAGGLGVIIPPSIPFIMYAMASGASVSDLFLAGIVPGVLIGFLLMAYAFVYCKRHGEDREKIDSQIKVLHDKGFFKVFKESFFAILSPVIVLGCIYSGVASPTEAAVISVFYSLIISMFIYKTLKFKDLWAILTEAMKTYAPIMFILAASTAFSRVLTLMQVPQMVSAFILENFTNKRHRCGRQSHPFRCRDGSQPGDRFRDTSDRCKPFRGELPDRGSGYGNREKGNAHDHHVPHCAAADYLYSRNQPVSAGMRTCLQKTAGSCVYIP